MILAHRGVFRSWARDRVIRRRVGAATKVGAGRRFSAVASGVVGNQSWVKGVLLHL